MGSSLTGRAGDLATEVVLRGGEEWALKRYPAMGALEDAAKPNPQPSRHYLFDTLVCISTDTRHILLAGCWTFLREDQLSCA
jgi:hypothetical protein